VLGGLLLAGVLLLAVAVAILRSPWFEAWLADTLVHEIDKVTQESTSLDRARLTFLPPGAELTGLQIRATSDDSVLVDVASVGAPLALGGSRGVRLGVVRVVDPVVHLELDDQGRLTHFRAPPSAAPQPAGQPLTELPLAGLHLTGGSVVLRLPDGQLTGTDLALIPQPDDPGAARLTGHVDLLWRQFADAAELDVPGVRLGPTAIDVDDLRLDLHALSVSGPVHVPLQGDLDAELELSSDLRELSPLLTGPRFFLGQAQGAVHVHGPPQDLVADVDLSADGFAYDAPGKVWPRIRYGVDRVEVRAQATPTGVTLSRLFVQEEHGTVQGTGELAPVRQPDGSTRWELVQSDLTGDSLSLADLLQSFSAAPHPWVDFDGQLHANLAGPLAPLELTGPFQVDLADFTVRQGPVEEPTSGRMLDIPQAHLTGTLTLFKDHIVLDGQQLVTGTNHGTVLADIGFGPKGPLDLHFDLKQADLAILRPLGDSRMTGRGRLRGRLWGDFDALQARGVGDLRGFSVSGIPYADQLHATIATPDMKRLVLTDAVGRVGDTDYTGRFEMDFAAGGLPMDTEVHIQQGRVQDLIGMFVDLGDVATGDISGGLLRLKGPLNDMDGEADLRLGRTTLAGETFEQGVASGRMEQGTFTLDEITVERGQSDRLRLEGTVGREWALDLRGRGQLTLQDLDALHDLDGLVTGQAQVELTVGNTLFEPEPGGTLTVRQVQVGGRSLPTSLVQAETVDGVLTAHGDLLGDGINADLSLGLWEDQPYTLTATFDELPLDRAWPVAADGREITARMSGDVELWGTFGEVWSEPELRVRVPEVRVAWGEHTLRSNPARPWTLTLTGDTWELDDIGLTGGESTLTVAAFGRDGRILATGEGLIDAALLPAVVPGLTRAEGLVDVRVASGGPQSQTHVDLSLDAPLMRHEALPAALEDVKARATLTPDAFLLTHFESNVGGGSVVGDAVRSPRLAALFAETPGQYPLGRIEAQDWVPTRFDLLGVAEDVQMQWVDDLPPAVGDATLAFDGPSDALLLHADITVNDMAFTQRIDWEDWVVALEDYLLVEAPPTDEPPWFGLDIDIVADRTIRLLNNVSDATASAELTLMGDTSRMGLVGSVRVEDGVVYVQDRAFSVERGELRFDDPFSWDPLLDFDLQADIRSRARQYRVNYRISGPYSAWTSTTVSEPRLPQADINALLWFGVTADDLEDMGELTNAVGLVAADFVVKDFVQNDYLGLGLRDAELLERLPDFDLNTGVNLRGEYSSEPRLLISQRWSPTLSTSAEINLVRDDHFVRMDWRTDESLLLSAWYASRRREGYSLSINGAVGVDARWVFEFE